jgi:hypothetical protein
VVGLLEVLDLVGRLDVLTMVAAALRMLGCSSPSSPSSNSGP